jgi:hypothetical protein
MAATNLGASGVVSKLLPVAQASLGGRFATNQAANNFRAIVQKEIDGMLGESADLAGQARAGATSGIRTVQAVTKQAERKIGRTWTQFEAAMGGPKAVIPMPTAQQEAQKVLAELQARGITETTPKVGDLVNRARAIASWSGEAPIATVEPVRKAIGSLSSQSPIRDLASGLHNALMKDYDVAAQVLPEAKGAIDFATKLKEAAETMTRRLEQYRPGKVGRMLTRELETPGGAPGSGAWLTTFFDPRKRLVPQVLMMKTGEAQLKTLQEAYLANVFERFSDDGIINGPRLSSFITENQPKLKYAFQNNPDTLRALQRLAD